MTSQPRAGQNTQWCSIQRAGQNIQPTNKLLRDRSGELVGDSRRGSILCMPILSEY